MRDFLWPIEKRELIRVLPMALMMFCFLFNYTIMRDLKDTLILSSAGAEAIPFIKFWGTLPAAMVFVITYAKLSNVLKPKTLYTVTIIPFFLFFTLFGFVLYPFQEFFQPTTSAETLRLFAESHLPVSMQTTIISLIATYKNWIYAVFYVLAELWGSMGVSLLFWQFANDITSTEEAKRFYPRFTQLGNLALIFSGYAILQLSNLKSWDIAVKWLMLMVSINCGILLITYHLIQKWREKNMPALEKRVVLEKPKLSIKESFQFLIRSKYLGFIALLVLCYGVSTNLIEVVYKNQLKLFFPTAGQLGAFYGKLSMSIGVTTFLMVVCSGFVLSRISWRAAAIATPLFMLVTGGLFFSTLIYKEAYQTLFTYSPLVIGIILGSLQYSLSKGIKYALFDPSKEMAYIPLDKESKVKGKAAIDVIGGRLGKSGGGLFLQFVLIFGAISDNVGLLYLTVIAVIAIWIISVFKLNKLYKEKTDSIPVAVSF